MPNVLHHTHQPHHVHHSAAWYFMLAMAIVFVLILTLTLVPTITMPGTVIQPLYFKEAAYLQYLSGEKVMYTNPIELNNALVAYHAGEKILYDINNATWSYHVGEKSAVLDLKALNREDALFIQRMREKGLQ